MTLVSVKPSVRRIIWSDYPAFYASLVPLVAWIVYLAWAPNWRGSGPVLKAGAQPIYLALTVLGTIGAAGVLAYRLWLFFRLFRSGETVRGKISSVQLRRDRGKVEYSYIFNHQEFNSGAQVHRNARTKALKSGELVNLIVDPANPRRAFIRHLYTDE